MRYLKQSTAACVMLGIFVDNTDGYSPETGLTIAQADVRLSKEGSEFAQKNDATSASHNEFGWYEVTLDATDTNTLGELLVSASATGALPCWRDFTVLPGNVFDALISGSDSDYLLVESVINSGCVVGGMGGSVAGGIGGDVTGDVSGSVTGGIGGVVAGSITGGIGGSIAGGVGGNVVGSVASVAGDVDGDVSGSVTGGVGGVIAGSMTGGMGGSVAGGTASIAASGISASSIATAAADIIADEVWDEVLSSGAHATLFSAGKRLQNLVLRGGTAIAGCPSAIVFPGPWSSTDGIYEQNIVSIVDGTGAAQTRMILEYIGASRLAHVDRPWDIEPDSTSEIELLPSVDEIATDHGIIATGSATGVTLPSSAGSINDTYIGSVIIIRGGTGRGQARLITDYVGSTKVVTVSDAWTTVPDSTSIYKILPVGRTIVDSVHTGAIDAGALATDAVEEIADGIWDEARSGHTAAGTFGQGVASVQGSVTGDVSGSVAGDLGGNVVGDVSGSVAGNVGGIIAGSMTGGIGGSIAGGIGGNVVGSVASVTGNVDGNVTGDVSGSVAGDLGGNVVGDVSGSVAGDVGGNVVGSVASVTGAVGSISASGISACSFDAGAIDGQAFGASALSASNFSASAITNVVIAASALADEINAEIVDALNGDTYAEPGQEAPTATTTLADKIGYLYKAFRNKIEQTATTLSLYDDAGTTVDQKSTVSDDGTTYTRGEMGSGP